MIRFGFTADRYGFLPIASILRLYRWCGISFSEVTSKIYENPYAGLKGAGNMMLGIHLPNHGNCGYDFSSRHARERILEFLRNMKRYRTRFDFQYAVFHPPQEEIAERSYAFFIQNLKRIPYPLVLENVQEMNLSEFLLFYQKLKRELKERLWGICVDIPHSSLAGQNWEDYFKIFGGKVKVIHLSDCKNHVDSHLPFERGGDLDLVKILRRLKQLHFRGFINLEILPPSLADIQFLFENFLTVRKTLESENVSTDYSFRWIYLFFRLVGLFNN